MRLSFSLHPNFASGKLQDSNFKKDTLDLRRILNGNYLDSILLPTGSLIEIDDEPLYLDYDLLNGTETTLAEVKEKLLPVTDGFYFVALSPVKEITTAGDRVNIFSSIAENNVGIVSGKFAEIEISINGFKTHCTLNDINLESFLTQSAPVTDIEGEWRIQLFKDNGRILRVPIYQSVLKLKRAVNNVLESHRMSLDKFIKFSLSENLGEGMFIVCPIIEDPETDWESLIKSAFTKENLLSCNRIQKKIKSTTLNKSFEQALVFLYASPDENGNYYIPSKGIKEYYKTPKKFMGLNPNLNGLSMFLIDEPIE